MGTFLIAKDAKFLNGDNEYSDPTSRVRRQICVFVGRTCQKVHSPHVAAQVCVVNLYHSELVQQTTN